MSTSCRNHHHHAPPRGRDNKRRLGLVLILAVGYMIAEAVGGLLTNSLALLADAGHMLSDAAALGLSLFALWIAQRPPKAHRTFGSRLAEDLAQLEGSHPDLAYTIAQVIETLSGLGI